MSGCELGAESMVVTNRLTTETRSAMRGVALLNAASKLRRLNQVYY
jgi:hypothetical protein